MTRGSRSAAAALLLLALASGCMASKETRRGADELEEGLGTPAWASSVAVTSGLDGEYSDEVRIEVVLRASATADDVTDFVVDLPERVTEAGLEDVPANKKLEFVSASQSRLAIEWGVTVSPDEVRRGAAEWFAVDAALDAGVVATARIDGASSYVVTFDDGASTAAADAVEVLEPLSEPDTSWQLLSTSGDLTLELSGDVLPSDDRLSVWRGLVGALSALPADLPASSLRLAFSDRTVADLTLIAPDDTTDESFTIEAYGERVWPAVRPQLDAIRTRDEAWSYFANWSPTYAPLQNNLFISVLSDQPTTDNGDESTRWSQAAKDYADR